MSHFVGSRGSNIKAVLQELHLVSWNKCGDRFFSPIISYYQLINAFWGISVEFQHDDWAKRRQFLSVTLPRRYGREWFRRGYPHSEYKQVIKLIFFMGFVRIDKSFHAVTNGTISFLHTVYWRFLILCMPSTSIITQSCCFVSNCEWGALILISYSSHFSEIKVRF